MFRHRNERNRKSRWFLIGLSVILEAGMLVGLTGCRSPQDSHSREGEDAPVGTLVLAVEDALGPVALAVKQAFEYEHPGILLSVSFGHGEDLTYGIEHGEPCDLLLMEAGETLERLEKNRIAGNVQALMADPLVLAAAPDNPRGIRDLPEMTEKLKEGDLSLAMEQKNGEMRLAVEKLLKSYGGGVSSMENSGRIWFCVDGASCADTVLRGEADCGLLCRSEALDTSLVILDTPEKDRYDALTYSSAIPTASLHPDGARMFLDYLSGETGRRILTEYGYESLTR